MHADVETAPVAKSSVWAGRIISALVAVFFLIYALVKFVKPASVVEGTLKLGYPESIIVPLGVVQLACTLLYVIPRTSMLGAILLTGYLGGAVAAQVRAGSPLFTLALVPAYFGALVWAGLYLRDTRVRALLPLTRDPHAT